MRTDHVTSDRTAGSMQRWGSSINQPGRWPVAGALMVATVGDAGPEIVRSGSLVAGYDGPGPLIYLAVAAYLLVAPWRYAPLIAVVLGGMFIVGGLSDPEFTSRLVTSENSVDLAASWLQVAAFAAAILFGLHAVPSFRYRPRKPEVLGRTVRPTSIAPGSDRGRVVAPLIGLGIAILGLLVQWVAKPSVFEAPAWGGFPGNFPPGAVVISVVAVLTVLCARWWWSTGLAAAIAAWIFVGGIGTGEMGNAATSGNTGSIVGLVVMSIGLVLALFAGAFVAVARRRGPQ